MPKLRLSLAVLLGLLLAACGPAASELPSNQTGFVAADGSVVVLDETERQPAAALTATNISGGKWQLSDLQGKVVLLNTWGPWCAPCREELPLLQEIYEANAAAGLEIVGFATRTNTPAVETFIAENQITFTQVADFDSAVMVQLDGVPSTTVPSTVFVDRLGRIAGWALGNPDAALLRSVVKSLLDEKS